MLESRSAYGYFGEGFGASGEQPEKTHANGWKIWTFRFKTTDGLIEVKAKDYDNAVKRANEWAKRDGFIVLECIDRPV